MVEYGKSRAAPKNCGKKKCTKELHMRALTGKQKGKKMNFCGPGTNFDIRIARGDKPINWNDKCCKAHDAVYNKKDTTRKQIQKSDDDMLKCMKANPKKSLGSRVEDKIMAKVFKGKRKLETVGILDPAKLTDTELYKNEGKFAYQKQTLKKLVSKDTVKKVLKKGTEKVVKKVLTKHPKVAAAVKAVKLGRQGVEWYERQKEEDRKKDKELGRDLRTPVDGAKKIQEKRERDKPHLAKEPSNVQWEGYNSGGIDRKMNAQAI